ncbi:MAG: NAD(P)(+) transhydrogenase [Bdellovibrionales bacterium RIFOXYD12_FULL_39_22]|nr:MAG: NAD(P)(+) transhydrogenase [Bdellovibrionales bacterium RIFOXYB1_FULL_39_21]OFZ41086.1 MAG: NAD(P)(+) transhydrogenase [Bdellovibrionales bacterium RIFOXYC12_FULL_39_17]OFZ50299.1 MAG: NAD(P)(+) transhydrogenase [Bdellovibrionales bacterium RIFOXYC1_FULL_39_130]OFZ75100.1 MAG: NAD(P)(+) transhydrogenase [Bdellovibrionales bacterium RIFOXYD1_FULL_39_84]OFZ92258.1 MAG: NAD(P)(+) transhydrogenase [Bdellovibrionales bacterium RIFOXYD12_FULL_39_22]HLE10939.1 Si-specific NAD(P)(+) transhydro
MDNNKFDAIVIGSGPAGEGAAMKIAKAGKKVAIIEKFHTIGGCSAHFGTIPSKVLRQSIQEITAIKNNPLFQNLKLADNLNISYPQLLQRSHDVIAEQVKMRIGFYKRNNIKIIHGHAKFLDTNTIEIVSNDGIGQTSSYQANAFFIATGSAPYHPPNVDFSNSQILDSNTILNLSATPKSLTIYGAGVIGCEYASFFQMLGVSVNLINTQSRLLNFLDDEITDALGYHLREQGVTIYHNETYDKVDAKNGQVTVTLKSGKSIRSEYLLWANGRAGNTQNLGLANISLVTNNRMQLDVNEFYQTTIPTIYAIGDVIGHPSLASASFDQGRFAATHFVEGSCQYKLNLIPTGIYTAPEISSIGKTERELTSEKIPYEIGHSTFKNLTRAQIIGTETGILKILFHRENLQILGVHCFGLNAAEIIHIGQVAMAQGADINSLINTTFNYPTMAEAYRIAALNGINRL